MGIFDFFLKPNISCLFKGNNNISSETALKLLKAAEEKSRELGVKMNISVVDSGANLVGFLRSVLKTKILVLVTYTLYRVSQKKVDYSVLGSIIFRLV